MEKLASQKKSQEDCWLLEFKQLMVKPKSEEELVTESESAKEESVTESESEQDESSTESESEQDVPEKPPAPCKKGLSSGKSE